MQNKVQIKIFALTCIIVAALIIGISVRSQLDEIRIKVLHDSRTFEETQQLEQIYKLLDRTMESFVYDYTYWDEMLNFVIKPTDKWAKENIDEVLPKFNVQASWVIDKEGKLVYSTNQLNDQALSRLPFEQKTIDYFTRKKKFSHFYIQTRHGLMEIRTAPIQPSSDFKRETEPVGFYIAGRLWTKEYLTEISNILTSKVILLPDGGSDKDKMPHTQNKFDIVVWKKLFSWDDKPIATIFSIKPSAAIAEMDRMNRAQFVRGIIFLLGVVVVLIIFLYFYINKPLSNISKSLKSMDPQFVKRYLKNRDEFGEIAGLITKASEQQEWLSSEIEERKKAEKRYRTLFENNPAPMMIYDLNTLKILEVNDAATTHYGYSAEEFLELTITDIHPAEDLPKLKENLREERKTVERSGLWRHIKKDGTIIYVEIISHELMYLDKTEARYVLMNDVTEKILAEEAAQKTRMQLQQKEKLASLGLLVAGVAHEINNPNSFIKFNMNYIKQYFSEIFPILDEYHKADKNFKIGKIDYLRFKDDLQDLIADMSEGSERITRIVDDLKNFAKVDQDPVVQEFNLTDTIKTTLRLLATQIKNKKISVQFDDYNYSIIANQQKTGQIFLNILSNAIEAVKAEEGIIKISILRTNFEGLIITVEDNGCGISNDNLNNVFDPFYTTKGKTGGTGLGLSVTKGLVESMDFLINIESELGKWTKVIITVPYMYVK